jgi:hypothetical protein
MRKVISHYPLHNLQIFFPGLFICAILYVSQVNVGICLGSSEFYHVYCCQQAWAHRAEVCIRLLLSSSPHVPYSYASVLEKLSLHSLHKRRHHLDALFFVQVYRDLKSCTFLFESVTLRVPIRNVRDFSNFSVVPQITLSFCSVRAYAANVVGKDLDIFAIGAVSPNHIL